MSNEHHDTSVFTDDSGARRKTVTWVIRGMSCALAMSVAAATVSILGHVTLPGLDAPLRLPGTAQAKKVASSEPADIKTFVPEVVSSSEPQPTSSTVAVQGTKSGATRDSVPRIPAMPSKTRATVAPTAPTVPVTTAKPKKPHGKPTAKPPTAANPEPTRGGPPSVPPGKAKKTTTAQ